MSVYSMEEKPCATCSGSGLAWQAGDIVKDGNNDLWWRSWDNSKWVFLLRFPGNWVKRAEVLEGDEPIEPKTLVLRELGPYFQASHR